MIKKYAAVLIIGFFFTNLWSQSAAESASGTETIQKMLLTTVSKDIESYQGSELKLVLRFQKADLDSKIISFYDEENVNIYFDVASIESDKELYQKVISLHRGVEYVVVFTVAAGSEGETLQGVVKDFYPFFLTKLP